MKPVSGVGKVFYPGQGAAERMKKAYEEGGIEIVDEIVDYLRSDDIHYNRYDHKNRVAD